MPKARPDTAYFTIGWIAPLALELAAARAAFDTSYDDFKLDGYLYHAGTIGEHHVIMAVQPKIGTDGASALAARMNAAFKNLKVFFVVGIGGGVPSYGPAGDTSQIVLGDVVVSVPRGNHGGVVQYDVGAWTGDGELSSRGHTNGPPSFMLNTVQALRSKHMASLSEISVFLRSMRLKISEHNRRDFEDPGEQNDHLFPNHSRHPDGSDEVDCIWVCGFRETSSRQDRGRAASREIDHPRVHYGNIGSSNQLQISAETRDRYHKEHDIICYEMEGAGVISNHPCLVIRGICDYSDSHKNKIWQPYAAITAAAYAKELLYYLPAAGSQEDTPCTLRVTTKQGMLTFANDYVVTSSSDQTSPRQSNNIGHINTGGGKAVVGNTITNHGPMNF
jgi:nucleoside phosphorylase